MEKRTRSAYGLRCALAMLLAVAMGCAALPLWTAAASDTLEVQALQGVVAALLAMDSAQSSRDVNGDGQVDVRDFQGLLGKTCPEDSEEQGHGDDAQWQAAAVLSPSPTLRFPPASVKPVAHSPLPECGDTPVAAKLLEVSAQEFPVPRARSRCLLLPHAPPV